jgi:hypothetical protein
VKDGDNRYASIDVHSAMSGYRGRREFRLGPGFILFYVLLTLFFAAGAAMTYRQRGWSWVSLTLAGATILGLGAILESLMLRIQLTDDALVVTDLRGRRRLSDEGHRACGGSQGRLAYARHGRRPGGEIAFGRQ